MKLLNLLGIMAFLLISSSLQAQDTLAQNSIAQLDSIYKIKKKPEEQLPYALAMVEKGQKEYGVQDTAYAKLLFKLGSTYTGLRNYSNASTYLQQAIEIQKAKIPEKIEYASSLNAFAAVNFYQGRLQAAEKLWLQTLELRKKILGKKHFDYAGNVVNLGSVYYTMGYYAKAEPFYLSAITIFEKQNLQKHPFYMNCLNNLGTLYSHTGNYIEAEKLFFQALQIRKEVLGEKHNNYAASLLSLGVLYQKMGDYSKAETYYLQALQIRKEILDEKHPDYVAVLNNLGVLYFDKKEYDKAETFYLQSLQIRKETVGEKHQDYASSLHNLGTLYQRADKYGESERLLQQALEIRKELVGEKHQDYAASVLNMGLLYYRTKQYEKSVPFYLQALQIHKETLGEKHSDYAKNLDNLGLLYNAMGDYNQAAIYYTKVLPIHLSYLEYVGAILGEKSKQDVFKTVIGDINNVNIFAARHRTHDSLLAMVQDEALLVKGYALTGVSDLLPLIKSLNDSTLNEIYDDWTTTKFQIGKVYNLSLAAQTSVGLKLDSLERLAAEQEGALMRGAAALKDRLGYSKKRFYYKDLVAATGKDEVVIDLIYVQPHLDSAWYYALVTQQGWKYPKFIPLCTTHQLDSYSLAEIAPNKESYITKMDWSKELYDLVIKPLEPYIKNKKTIHWSPIGMLNEFAIGVFRDDKDKMLLDRYTIHQYSSLKDFIIKKQGKENTNSKIKNALLVGNITFDLETAEHINLAGNSKDMTEDIELYVSRSVSADSTRGSSRFVSLKGTKVEVENLSKAFSSKKWTIEQLQQKDALEENVKDYTNDNTPLVLHFATHGFFIPSKKKGYDNPLMRSGIALAGANRVWMGKSRLEGVEDGLWTAYEIANSNLMQADLVVLSACETAKGQIDPHEGVVGLQRSFKIAGVEHMLLSLWQVPDKETVELMEEFYKHYLKGIEPSEALRKAQMVMRKKYPEPYYWAAFVLIE